MASEKSGGICRWLEWVWGRGMRGADGRGECGRLLRCFSDSWNGRVRTEMARRVLPGADAWIGGRPAMCAQGERGKGRAHAMTGLCHSVVSVNFGAMGEALSNALVTGLTPDLLFVTILGSSLIVVGHLSFKAYLSHRTQERECVVAVRQCLAMSRQETKRLGMVLQAFGRLGDRCAGPPPRAVRATAPDRRACNMLCDLRRVRSAQQVLPRLNSPCRLLRVDIVFVGQAHADIDEPSPRRLSGIRRSI